MSANVALSETFDQWRVKTNEVLVMTQTDGSSNFLKLTNTTNATSNTTGSIITAGGVGIAKSAVIGENLNVHGNIHANGAITADGNLTFGNADTDSVTFQADVNSNFIPNSNVAFNIGNTVQMWANVFAESFRGTQAADAGLPALHISGLDVDKQLVTISGAQTVNTVASITGTALTTNSAIIIEDSSADVTARKSTQIKQSSASAYQATALDILSGGGRVGIAIDKNYTHTTAATVKGLYLDMDQTGALTSGTMENIGLDVELNGVAGSGGTVNSRGIDVDVVGTGGGTSKAIGVDVTVGSADTNYAALFAGGNTGFGVTDPDSTVEILSTTRQLKLSYDGTNATGFTVDSGGALVIDSAVTATSFSGPLSGTTVAMSGKISTTDNMVANNTTVVANSAITAHGGIGLSLEMTKDAQPSAGTGVMYMKDGGGLYWRSNEKTEIELSASAGISAGTENTFSAQQTFDDQALTSGASVAWNANTAQVATLTLGHNATMSNATNHKAGGVYILRVTQAVAPKTLAWSSGYKWPGNTAPTMTTTASAVDIFTFTSDGTYMYGSFSGSQNFT